MCIIFIYPLFVHTLQYFVPVDFIHFMVIWFFLQKALHGKLLLDKVNLELQLLLIILHFDCTNFIFCFHRGWRSSIYFAATQSIFTSSKFWFGKQNFRKSITEPRASSSRCKISIQCVNSFHLISNKVHKITIFRKIVRSCLVITNYT